MYDNTHKVEKCVCVCVSACICFCLYMSASPCGEFMVDDSTVCDDFTQTQLQVHLSLQDSTHGGHCLMHTHLTLYVYSTFYSPFGIWIAQGTSGWQVACR